MAKKNIPKIKADAKAVAKVEASIKASYQRKKTITEVVPEDVTRAKAGACLALISPITEWAGMRGDALRYKREQLRIQQDLTLERLAKSIHKNGIFDMDPSRVNCFVPPDLERTIGVKIYYPSELGVEFLNACHPQISRQIK